MTRIYQTGIFPKEFSGIIQALFDDRQVGDYGIFVEIEKDNARGQLDAAERLVSAIRTFLDIQK